MNIAEKPVHLETGPTEDLTNWGEQWKRRQAEAEEKAARIAAAATRGAGGGATSKK